MKENSALKEFIQEELKGHREPQKRGIPRGLPVGPSHRKFHASLLLLTRDSQKNIAEKAETSYPLLLKWRTEAGFRRLCAQQTAEFIKIYFRRVRQSRKLSGFEDIWAWSEELILNIWDCIDTAMREDTELTIEKLLPHFIIFKDLFLSPVPDSFGPPTETIIFKFRILFLNELCAKIDQSLPSKALFDHFCEALIRENLLKMRRISDETISGFVIDRKKDVLLKARIDDIMKDQKHRTERIKLLVEEISRQQIPDVDGNFSYVAPNPKDDEPLIDKLEADTTLLGIDKFKFLSQVFNEVTWDRDLLMYTRQILNKDRQQIAKWLKGKPA